MMIIVLVIIGGCYATFEIIRDKYPDEYEEFVKELKRHKPKRKREYVGKHTPRKTRKPTQVKTRRKNYRRK